MKTQDFFLSIEGKRMDKKQIQLSVPNLDIEIVDNLRECIETGWVSTGGRFITEFEQKMAKYVGIKDAVSAQSGTAGWSRCWR